MALHNAEFDLHVLEKHSPELPVYDWVDAGRVGTPGCSTAATAWPRRATRPVGRASRRWKRAVRDYLDLHIPKEVQDGDGNDVRIRTTAGPRTTPGPNRRRLT